jgi:hypothetical protein
LESDGGIRAVRGELARLIIDLESLRRVYDLATVMASAVQNRFTQDTANKPKPAFVPNLPYPPVTFDRDVREYCRQTWKGYVDRLRARVDGGETLG